MHYVDCNWSMVKNGVKWRDRLMKRTREVPSKAAENRFLDRFKSFTFYRTCLQLYLCNINRPLGHDLLHILVDLAAKH